MSEDYSIARFRPLITRIAISLCLLSLAARAFYHDLSTQLVAPPLFRVDYNVTYWLLKNSFLDNVIIYNNTFSLLFRVLLFTVGIALVIFPLQRWLAILFAVLYFFEVNLLCIHVCFTPHVLGGFVIIVWAFCVRSDRSFSQWWQALRYYSCFIFFSAFLWKLSSGALTDMSHGIAFTQEHYAQFLYHYPNSWFGAVIQTCLQHPAMIAIVEKILFFSQAVFCIGFFTTKYDGLLIFCMTLFLFSISFAGAYFFYELAILMMTFIPAAKYTPIVGRFPILNK